MATSTEIKDDTILATILRDGRFDHRYLTLDMTTAQWEEMRAILPKDAAMTFRLGFLIDELLALAPDECKQFDFQSPTQGPTHGNN